MSELGRIAIGTVGGLVVSTGVLLVIFIGFLVIAGRTKFRRRHRKSLVVRSLAEKMGADVRYLTPDSPRGQADQLNTPELAEQSKPTQ